MEKRQAKQPERQFLSHFHLLVGQLPLSPVLGGKIASGAERVSKENKRSGAREQRKQAWWSARAKKASVVERVNKQSKRSEAREQRKQAWWSARAKKASEVERVSKQSMSEVRTSISYKVDCRSHEIASYEFQLRFVSLRFYPTF